MTLRNAIILMPLLCVVSLGAAAEQWYDESTGYTWFYNVKGDGVEIANGFSCAVSPYPSGMLEIPETLAGYSVTEIGDWAFQYCWDVTDISFPRGLKLIGNRAFQYCASLASLIIPPDVAVVGEGAFGGCSNLKSVTVPACISCMSDVFPNTSITNVILCEGFKQIPGSMFAYMPIESIDIPEGVSAIGDSAFFFCRCLRSVNLPGNVKTIGKSAFQGCSSLMTMAVPKNVTSIGSQAFVDCESLTAINVDSENRHYMSVDGVLYDKSLSVMIACPNDMKTVVVPATVIDGVGDALHGCHSLGQIAVEANNPRYKVVDGVLYDMERFAVLRCQQQSQLVEIPVGMVKIGDYAFSDCNKLQSIMIPTSITEIGCWAFYKCDALQEAVVPEGVKKFSWCVFNSCAGLRSVSLPSTLKSMSELVFDGCTNLISITVAKGSATYSSKGGILYDQSGTELLICPGGRTVVEIPNGVTSIGYPAFYNNHRLLAVSIPRSMTLIHSGAFNLCERLSTMYVEAGDMSRVVGMLEASGMSNYYMKRISFVEMERCKVQDGVEIPSIWAAGFPDFNKKYGSDFVNALYQHTDKYGCSGQEMLVWQDYVAGTDPTKKGDVFKASITKDENGKIIISYTPEFEDEDEKAKRKYTTLGKKSLMDGAGWEVVPEGRESDYNFFKVTVEMRQE